MSESRNFVATVKEPHGGFAVFLEFHADIPGLNGDIAVIELHDGVSLDDAKMFADTLNRLGKTFSISD